MASWLQRQRKADLVDLAQQAGMQRAVITMRKDDLIMAIEQHFRTNASTLSNEAAFHDYFDRISSPVKIEADVDTSRPSDEITSTVHSRGKRRISKDLLSETDIESSPRLSVSGLSRVSQTIREADEPVTSTSADLTSTLSLPMPPSPAAVADLVERRTTIAATNIRQYYMSHQIPWHVASLREALSTVYAVNSGLILMEAWGLQRTTLPWKYAFSLPSSPLATDNSVRIYIPDFFVLLDGSFWGPTFVWSVTSFLLPMFFGWLINFTSVHGRSRRGGHEVDPLVFNIVKVLVTWLVYSQGQSFGGLFTSSTVQTVHRSIPGGWRGMIIGAAIGTLISIYEAILRK